MLREKLELLKKELADYAKLVEEMIHKSIDGLLKKNKKELLELDEKDEPKANELDLVLDEFGTSLIAQYEPRAKDLRAILMILKMSNDLERMGDHAVNIAHAALGLIDKPDVKPLIDIPKMAKEAASMLHDSIQSFVNEDAKLALEVCKRDNIVDELRNQVWNELMTIMTNDPSTVERALLLIRIAQNLERVADLSTNIGEDVIFMVEGRVIKHHKEE